MKKKTKLFFCLILIITNFKTAETNTQNSVYSLENQEITPSEDTSMENGKNPENMSQEESVQKVFDIALEYCDLSKQLWAEGGMEKAIEALDQAYNLILNVDPGEQPNLMQQKEDIRFLISKRILEIYSSRFSTVKGNHKAIPLIINQHVEREIKSFQGPERNFFIESYKRSGKYRDKIVKSLKAAGIPEELSWLPLVESGFKVKALSKARALGLWQFIPSTGYKFGLKRDKWIDERLDPEKSTRAAIDYLTELHNLFGDWATVLAAYNCGEYRVLGVIKRQKLNYLDNFWDLYTNLPEETARYVPRFLATLLIVNDPEKYGMPLNEKESPDLYETLEINKPILLDRIAKKIEVPVNEIINLNSELRYLSTPEGTYTLKVPEGKKEKLISVITELPTYAPLKTTDFVTHKVRRGETLSTIAAKYRTSVAKIISQNRIKKINYIKLGQRLKIPTRYKKEVENDAEESEKEIDENESDVAPPTLQKYTVREGDSLWKIAKKFKTDPNNIQKLNNLDSEDIYVGQNLKLAGE